MLRKFVALVMLATPVMWAVPSALAQDAKTVLANASKAMGADNLKSIQYSGTATESLLSDKPLRSVLLWPGYVDKSYTRTINFGTPAWRVDRVLADIPPDRRGGGLPPGPSQTVIVGSNTPWAAQVDLWMTPYGFLRAAANANGGASVASKSMHGKKYTVVTFTAPNKAKMNGYIDADNMLDRVETWVDTPMLGDTLLEADYSGYKDFGGVKFPTAIEVKEGFRLPGTRRRGHRREAQRARESSGQSDLGAADASSHFAEACRWRLLDPPGLRSARGRF